VTIVYNAGGRVAEVRDTLGLRMAYQYDYDRAKRQFYVRTQTGGGKVTETWYDTEGAAIRQDLNGRTVSSVLKDGRDRIHKDGAGNATRRDYDEFGNLTKVTYADGATVSYQYEHTYSNITQMTNELGVVTKYEYGPHGNLKRRTEALGLPEQRVTEYIYDPYGQRTQIKQLGDAVTQEAITGLTYDDYGNVATYTDAENNTTEFTAYDVMGNPLARKDPLNNVWPASYYADGKLHTSADPLGHTTQYEYNKVGNLTKVIDPLDRPTTYVYDARGNRIQRIDALNGVQRFEYDADDHLVRRADEEAKSIEFTYTAGGRLETIEDQMGNLVRLERNSFTGRVNRVVFPTFSRELSYDTRLRQTGSIDVLDAQTRYSSSVEYDISGRPVAEVDAKGRRSERIYDSLGRFTETIDAASQSTSQGYDARDNRIRLTDANGNTHSFEHDRADRVRKEIRPLGQATSYRYDGAGWLVEKDTPNGKRIEYEYDSAGRRTTMRYFSTLTATDPIKTVIFAYDDAGKLTGYDDGVTSATYTYDDVGRKLSETVNYGPFSKSYQYTYYQNGAKQTYTGPDGVTYTYTYNEANQLTSISIPGQGAVTYNGYRWQVPESVTLPGGTKRSYDYDPLLRTTAITVEDPANNPVLYYTYTYDPVGNIESKLTEHGAYVYTYDTLDRLTEADTPLGVQSFTYDPVGNRLTSNATQGAWVYNENNELLSYSDIDFIYDASGNTVQKTQAGTITHFRYDPENRMTAAEDDSGTPIGQYYYDPFGRRLWKDVDGQRTYFLYADEGVVAELDATGNTIRTYGYKPDSAWGTDPIYQKSNNEYTFYENDHLGTPQQLTDVAGSTLWEARYRSFGEAQVLNDAVENSLRLPGQYADSEIGLYYNNLRYYDAAVGRYVTSDPIGLRGGLNTYRYARANPLRFIDPLGLLVNWMGSVWGGGAVNIGGGGLFRFDLTSECKCNMVWHIKGTIVAGALGVGYKALKVSGGSGAVNLHSYDDCPDPDAANGGAGLIGVNSIPGGGFSLFSKIRIGHLWSDFSWFSGPVYGFDISAGVFIGFSVVTSAKPTPCCSEN
jgi:RHS repeat-associated protein